MEMTTFGTDCVKLKNLFTMNFFFLHVATKYVKSHMWFALYLYRTEMV